MRFATNSRVLRSRTDAPTSVVPVVHRNRQRKHDKRWKNVEPSEHERGRQACETDCSVGGIIAMERLLGSREFQQRSSEIEKFGASRSYLAWSSGTIGLASWYCKRKSRSFGSLRISLRGTMVTRSYGITLALNAHLVATDS